jgi:hypothetical protein
VALAIQFPKGKVPTDEIGTIREEFCQNWKHPATFTHDRLDQRRDALEHWKRAIGFWPTLEISERLDEHVGHGGCGKKDRAV